MNALRRKAWSPYLVGALIGVLSWFTFASADRPLGITTAFEYSAALSVDAAGPELGQTNAYFDDPDKDPKIDWEWMLVVGVFLGAWLSSSLSGDRGSGSPVPRLWQQRFGPSVGKRYAGAFLGGALIMLGARLAQGCTSGHGISGALQLAVSSWMFVVVFVASALAAAFVLYDQHGDRHV